MTERRAQPRLLDADLVLVSWEDDHANRLIQLGNVEDISLNGLGFIVDDPIRPGTRISISYGDEKLTAIVMHNAKHYDGGYFTGIEFLEESRNSAAHFQPELLIRSV